MAKVKQLEMLTFLRFVAAAWVFFDHYGKDLLAGAPFALGGIVSNGRLAVSFFFILSGFVLVYSNTTEGRLGKSPKRFLLARVARIYPIYFFALCIPLPFKLWKAVQYGQWAQEFSNLPFVLTLSQSWCPSIADAWNPPAWSLSVEALFYLGFPLALYGMRRLHWSTFAVFACVFVVVGEALRAWLLVKEPIWGIYFPPLHLSLFIWGMALGRLFQERQAVKDEAGITAQGGNRWSLILWGINLSIIYGVVVWYSKGGHTMLALPVIAVLLGGLIYTSASLNLSRLCGGFSTGVFLLLGEASYALYIVHMPVMEGLKRISSILIPGLNVSENLAAVGVGFLLCIAFSVLLYFCLERPVRKIILGLGIFSARLPDRPVEFGYEELMPESE